jgi:hypothetical protein
LWQAQVLLNVSHGSFGNSQQAQDGSPMGLGDDGKG